MQPIQMVDTKNQYLKIKSEIEEEIQSVLNSAQYINGKIVHQFSENLSNYLQANFVVPCANGTDALQIALMALDLQPGDEIITPSFTYIATVEVIALLQLKPVFIDVNPITFCIDENLIESKITNKTKAIIPVHLFGQAANMEKIMHIAHNYNLYVIEDNAQSIGASFIFSSGEIKKTGTIGHIGTTSFYPSKNLGCFGDGGAITTNDEKLAEKLKMIANHGQSKRYYHDIVGCNSRLDSIQAAVLNVKLKYLNEYSNSRINVANYYNTQFKDIGQFILPEKSTYSTHVYNQYTIQLKNIDRDSFIEYLASNNIPTMIYYPVAAHQQKMMQKWNSQHYNLPITEKLCNSVISLPIHTEMTEEQLQYISTKIQEFLN